jgi:hypothetical protein
MRAVFSLNRLGYVRFVESVLVALLERGDEVVLLVERAPMYAYQERWLEQLEREPGFAWRHTRAWKRDPLRGFRRELRKVVDYLYFLGPRFEEAPALPHRARRRAPAWAVRALELPPLRWRGVRRALAAVATALDHALPAPAAVVAELRELRPDVVVAVPHGMPGSRDSDVVAAAKELGVPTAVAVASWDNLSSKQQLHVLPHRLLVWNETQRTEAAELHGVDPRSVVTTGAQNFDLWFDWEPGDRAAYCRKLGLDPARPYVLYLGGSLYEGARREAEWVRRWVAALRASREPLVADAGIVVRPHPTRAADWQQLSLADLEGVVVAAPAAGEMPVADDARRAFHDAIHHSAAVVGLNTTALIEAAIVGRSVLSVQTPEFDASQRGVFHFDYLLTVGGGLGRSATSLEEHVAQLEQALRGEDADAELRRRRFLEAFVRPAGLDRPATPAFVAALDELAGAVVTAERPSTPRRALAAALAAAARARRRRSRRGGSAAAGS